MDYDKLIDYVRGLCRVRVHKDRSTIYGGARGTFQVTKKGPLITLATRGVSKKKLTETLLHELGHFLQHQDGFMSYIDNICDSYTVARDWYAGHIELTDMELQVVRNCMLTMEYDAERRGHNLGLTLGVKYFTSRYYLKGAQAYMDSIKWSFARRVNTPKVPHRKGYKGILLDDKKLYASLSRKKMASLDSRLSLRKYQVQSRT